MQGAVKAISQLVKHKPAAVEIAKDRQMVKSLIVLLYYGDDQRDDDEYTIDH